MTPEQMKARTRAYALRVMRLCESLPRGRAIEVMARQLLRAAFSVGANYRAACRAKSKPDFVAKMGIVEEELDESSYWVELLGEAKQVKPARVGALLAEASELTAIVVSSINTARGAKRSGGRPVSDNPHSAIHNPQ
jgi:four helix bundle protein